MILNQTLENTLRGFMRDNVKKLHFCLYLWCEVIMIFLGIIVP